MAVGGVGALANLAGTITLGTGLLTGNHGAIMASASMLAGSAGSGIGMGLAFGDRVK